VKKSVELWENISGFQCSPQLLQLLEVVEYNPMTIALAASTIKIRYQDSPDSDLETIIRSYKDSLSQDECDIQEVAVSFYCAAAISDSRIRHTFDFLGACNPKHPVLLSALPIHLSMKFHGIPEEALATPPLDPILENLKSKDHESYWSHFKSMVPFLPPSGPSDDDITKALKESQDEVAFVRQSPILSFRQSWCGEDFEFVTVHEIARHKISELFREHTASILDENCVSKEFEEFQQNSWFKNYRRFDGERALKKFHRTLPGLSSGVYTEAQFHNMKYAKGLAGLEKMTYSQYVHVVSHYHRVLNSLVSTLRSVNGEMRNVLMKKCLLPHLKAIKDCSFISEADKLTAEISILSIDAASSSGDVSKMYIAQYEQLIAKLRALLGAKSPQVASSLVDLADLQLSLRNSSAAKHLLQSAVGIYKHVPIHLQHDAFSLDMAHALSSLALACSELGEKESSKDFYDQALAISQSVPSSGRVGVQQRQVVASLLISVTHAYLCLGDLPVARKYCELATMMLQSVYPQGHAEVIRLFNIRSIVSALMGDRDESSKFRMEAAKLKAKLDAR
jgi:tetratricopeptide (TPR) repeat protein